MKYLKVFTDFAEDIAELNDSEKGRLFQAMLDYAKTETAPDLRGNEKYVWPTAKKNIDKQIESYGEVCKINKRIATERNGASRSVTERHGASEDKDKEKETCSLTRTRKEKADAFSDLAGENAELLSALKAFDDMRKRIKHPLTDRAKQLIITDLQKYDSQQWVDVLNQSIKNCWQGLYPLQDEQAKTHGKQKYAVQKHEDSPDELEKAAIAAVLEDEDNDPF